MHHEKRFPLFSDLKNWEGILTCPLDILRDYKRANKLALPHLGHLDFVPDTGLEAPYLDEAPEEYEDSELFDEYCNDDFNYIDTESGKPLPKFIGVWFNSIDEYNNFIELAESFERTPEELAYELLHNFMVIHEDKQDIPTNFSLTVELIRQELSRLNWTEEKAKEEMIKRYRKKSLHLMLDEELEDWLSYLKTL
uniref:Uncharacterized protein n=2 Tax=Gloeothece TaxID=28070 RepID=E0UJ71_GLOV7|nr:hypothetical protein Cyan7822_3842 [Gloeothece verrucosa PCC 7822]